MRSLYTRLLGFGLIAAVVTSVTLYSQGQGAAQETRVPWTASKIHGSPEPPPPYKLERVFPKLSFQKLTHMSTAPGTKRLFVTTELGQIYSFNPDDNVEKADLFLDLAKDVKSCQPAGNIKGFDALYSLTFHPKFPENRSVYVAYVVDGTTPVVNIPDSPKWGLRNRQRISRFEVAKTDPPKADPASEQILLEWGTDKAGHNGCTLCFGPDGYLYASIGDGAPASPPDLYNTGQDLSDLLASILRIDVNGADGNKPYKVPADNPFVKLPGARPEIWAYGLRNPWKMTFDRATGDLWTGDVGWERWEMIYRVRKGGNHGWSIVEGTVPMLTQGKQGPTPILPHKLAISHTEASSITGGYVYHGKRLPELTGSYIFGDWITSKVWSARFDADRIISHKEIAQGRMHVIAFGELQDGELLILGYGDAEGIYRLVPNAAKEASKFPRKLSETGLFDSVPKQTPAPGVLPFAINSEAWQDHATAQRWVALPNVSTVRFYDRAIRVPGQTINFSKVFFPNGAVVAKTISLEMERGKPSSARRLETQILHFEDDNWFAYTYRWNEAQTDAELVPTGGAEMELDIIDAEAPGGRRKQNWHFYSRTQCLMCHNYWGGPPLSFTPDQLNRQGQLERLEKIDVVAPDIAPAAALSPKEKGKGSKVKKIITTVQMVDPHDASKDLGLRARSYLHINCAHCHQNSAGGNATIDLRAEVTMAATKANDANPMQGTFKIPDGRLLAPGDPFRSVLYYRIAKIGPGRMPHIGSDIVDPRGMELIHDWIRSLPRMGGNADSFKDEKAALDTLLAFKGKDVAKQPAFGQLLSSTSGSLMLARALDKNQVPVESRQAIVAAATARPESEIRDLFERFLPPENRSKRLGTSIQPQTLLAMKGDVDAGRKVFFQTAGIQCAVCHKIGDVGGVVGPDLSQIGKKYDRAKLLESILEPSKDIEPAFMSHAVQLSDGRVVVGVIVSRNDKEIVLRDAQDKAHRYASEDVDGVAPQRQSLMPEQLLRDLTAQQAVDLLDFLAGLKGP